MKKETRADTLEHKRTKRMKMWLIAMIAAILLISGCTAPENSGATTSAPTPTEIITPILEPTNISNTVNASESVTAIPAPILTVPPSALGTPVDGVLVKGLTTKAYQDGQDYEEGSALVTRVRTASYDGVVIGMKFQRDKLPDISVIVDGQTMVSNFQIEQFFALERLFVDINVPSGATTMFDINAGSGKAWMTTATDTIFGSNSHYEVWSTESYEDRGIVAKTYVVAITIKLPPQY